MIRKGQVLGITRQNLYGKPGYSPHSSRPINLKISRPRPGMLCAPNTSNSDNEPPRVFARMGCAAIGLLFANCKMKVTSIAAANNELRDTVTTALNRITAT